MVHRLMRSERNMRAENLDFTDLVAFNVNAGILEAANKDLSEGWYQESEGPMLQEPNKGKMPQDSDYRANFYYYDLSRHLAFHWTGNDDDLVEVSYGGDHEARRWGFAYEDHSSFLFDTKANIFVQATQAFQVACMNWVDAKEDAR